MEYQTSDRIVYRSWKYNREHSLDRVILNEFNRKNDPAGAKSSIRSNGKRKIRPGTIKADG